MNFCPNCGTKLEQNASFCHNCGFKISQSSEQTTTSGAAVQPQKNKFLAGILAILLGSLGIHNFYLGYTGKGVAQLLMFVFWLGFFSFIWGIIDAIRIFAGNINCDAKGVPLSNNF